MNLNDQDKFSNENSKTLFIQQIDYFLTISHLIVYLL